MFTKIPISPFQGVAIDVFFPEGKGEYKRQSVRYFCGYSSWLLICCSLIWITKGCILIFSIKLYSISNIVCNCLIDYHCIWRHTEVYWKQIEWFITYWMRNRCFAFLSCVTVVWCGVGEDASVSHGFNIIPMRSKPGKTSTVSKFNENSGCSIS